MAWDMRGLVGPEGADWRVPVQELENRRARLSVALSENGIESALIDDPVELYWLTGGRQNGIILIGGKILMFKRLIGSRDHLKELNLNLEEMIVLTLLLLNQEWQI